MGDSQTEQICGESSDPQLSLEKAVVRSDGLAPYVGEAVSLGGRDVLIVDGPMDKMCRELGDPQPEQMCRGSMNKIW